MGPRKLDFYYDGQLAGSQNTPSDYKNPMYLMANLATQDGATDVGQNMKIDYIRAYSNDGSNPTVAARKKSRRPTARVPGMYGATALNGGPATPFRAGRARSSIHHAGSDQSGPHDAIVSGAACPGRPAAGHAAHQRQRRHRRRQHRHPYWNSH